MYETLELPEREQEANGPSFWDSAAELPRVVLEMTSLTYSIPWLASAPRGDGHASQHTLTTEIDSCSFQHLERRSQAAV